MADGADRPDRIDRVERDDRVERAGRAERVERERDLAEEQRSARIRDKVAGFGVTFTTMFTRTVTVNYPDVKEPTQPRWHGRHQLNRHPDGLEKCVGCELCAWACPPRQPPRTSSLSSPVPATSSPPPTVTARRLPSGPPSTAARPGPAERTSVCPGNGGTGYPPSNGSTVSGATSCRAVS